ncbi:MAG TPA: TVP38/TMEM64 family protein, partial [Longimicrobiaceae bacterium]|nr:TVP38/TMEM64 family protein [Longimicrobiaceae bacterium]
YAVATVAFVPGSVLTLAAGALFGLVDGVVYVFLGALVGSSAAFLTARYLARRPVERRLARDPRFAAVDGAVGREGWKIVFLLRLSPLFPYTLLNYALGLTRVRFRDYLAAAPGMIPGIVLYVYAGRVAGDAAALAAGARVPHGPGYYALLVAGLAATALVTWFITRLARRALAEMDR